jgi:hypothetical protein
LPANIDDSVSTDVKYQLKLGNSLIKSFGTDTPTPVLQMTVLTDAAPTGINNQIQNIDVEISFCGIKISSTSAKAKVDVKFIKAVDSSSNLDKDKCTLEITNVVIPNDATFDATELIKTAANTNIEYPSGADLTKMTLAQINTLITKNTVVPETHVDAAGTNITTMIKLKAKEENTNNTNNTNNNNTNEGTDAKSDDSKEKTTWTDISIVATSVASIIGVLLLAKMSFSPSNSGYNDNIQFDDYKDDSITI